MTPEREAQHHQLKVSRTAHYSTIGKAGKHIKYVWIACHGYGQLAKRFIQKFNSIASEDTLIIAPEGLSRFYWGGVTGEVAASWMTKGDRLKEIEDYTNFISQLYNHFLPQVSADAKIILFGFSQGCATIMRWVMRAFPRFHSLVFWAGMIPEDLDYRPYLSYFSDKTIYFIYGTEDEFLTPPRLDFIQNFIKKQNLVVEESTFEGPHKIIRSELKNLAEKLRD